MYRTPSKLARIIGNVEYLVNFELCSKSFVFRARRQGIAERKRRSLDARRRIGISVD